MSIPTTRWRVKPSALKWIFRISVRRQQKNWRMATLMAWVATSTDQPMQPSERCVLDGSPSARGLHPHIKFIPLRVVPGIKNPRLHFLAIHLFQNFFIKADITGVVAYRFG